MINFNSSFISLTAICLASLLSPFALAQSELIIASNPSSGSQREAFQHQVDAFSSVHPEIKVTLRAFEHESFKETVEANINKPQPIADVLFWFGGASLRHFASQGWLNNLSNLWQKNNWETTFSASATQSVTISNQQFGLPLYYYQWGIYYRRSLFEKFQLTPPETWQDFLTVSQTFKDNNVSPIVLGSKNHWTAAGWFDYINLRLNGLAFHLNLLNGCERFTDPKVKDVFKHIGQLSDAGYFLENAQELDWEEAMPYLYHNKAAMLLMGNFFLSSAPQKLVEDLGFFPFPVINQNIERYEDAPTDVLLVPNNSSNKENAYLFLEFMSQPDQQAAIAKEMNMIPTNKAAEMAQDIHTRLGAELLGNARGLAQFFDRDTHPEFAKRALPLISGFIQGSHSLESLLLDLEIARRHVWSLEHIRSQACTSNLNN